MVRRLRADDLMESFDDPVQISNETLPSFPPSRFTECVLIWLIFTQERFGNLFR